MFCGHPVPGHLRGRLANLSNPSSPFLSAAGHLGSFTSSDPCPSEVGPCVLSQLAGLRLVCWYTCRLPRARGVSLSKTRLDHECYEEGFGQPLLSGFGQLEICEQGGRPVGAHIWQNWIWVGDRQREIGHREKSGSLQEGGVDTGQECETVGRECETMSEWPGWICPEWAYGGCPLSRWPEQWGEGGTVRLE